MLQPNYMEKGSMFAMLLEYAEEDFCKEHPVIRFDTLEKEGKYEAPAAFYGKTYRVKDKNVFRYYNYTDLTDPADFDEYLDFVAGASLYETGVTAEYGDQLLTLITCSYNTTDGRFWSRLSISSGAGLWIKSLKNRTISGIVCSARIKGLEKDFVKIDFLRFKEFFHFHHLTDPVDV